MQRDAQLPMRDGTCELNDISDHHSVFGRDKLKAYSSAEAMQFLSLGSLIVNHKSALCG